MVQGRLERLWSLVQVASVVVWVADRCMVGMAVSPAQREPDAGLVARRARAMAQGKIAGK